MSGLEVLGLASANQGFALPRLQIKHSDLRALETLCPVDREQHTTDPRQHRPKPMVPFHPRKVWRRKSRRLSTARRDAPEPPPILGGKHNAVVIGPARTARHGRRALDDCGGRSPCDRYLLEVGAIEEPNPAAVRGEERLARVGRTGEGASVEAIDRAHDQLYGAFPTGTVDDVSAVGRDREVA